MTNPVPGYSVSTPYGKRGSYWSCNEDSNGNGIHTGVDYAAANGTKIVAARGGKVEHVNFGSAFGSHQMVVKPGDGTRDFYAHMRSRATNGGQVETGQKIGEVGSEGNVTGAHLHFERHKVASGGWSCGIIVDPQPSINYQADDGGGDDEMPDYVSASTGKDVKLKDGVWYAIPWESGSDDYFTDGEPGIKVQGPYSAVLAVTVVDRAGDGAVQASWVEWDMAKGEAAETSRTDSFGDVDNGTSARIGLVQEGRRLRARVRVNGSGGTLTYAQVSLLAFRPK